MKDNKLYGYPIVDQTANFIVTETPGCRCRIYTLFDKVWVRVGFAKDRKAAVDQINKYLLKVGGWA